MWSDSCQEALNKQINIELDASQQYLSLHNFFLRNDVGLTNIAKYFKKASEEEREHAFKMIEYQNKRGGRVFMTNIKDYNYKIRGTQNESDILIAFKMVLQLEKKVYQHLLELHRVADNNSDPQFADYIEGEFLKEQVEAIYELEKQVAILKRIGNNGYETWEFNNKLNVE